MERGRRTGDGDSGDDPYLGGFGELLEEVSRTGRRLDRAELDARRHLGEQAAEDGRALREVVGSYLAEARGCWRTLPGVAGARDATELRHVGAGVLTALESAVAAVASGYEQAQRLAVRREEAARREFIDDLLYGRSDLGRLAERAERFGLRLARSHTVTVAAAEDEEFDDGHPTARRVERELVGRFGERQVLLTTKEGRLVCVAPADEREVTRVLGKHASFGRTDVRTAVGRPHSGPGGVVRSYEEALTALDTAARLGLEATVLDAADLLVFPVLLRDRAAMADLVRSVLGPLTTARGGGEPLLETLTVHAAAGYNATEAARRLNLSVRALTYRLQRIRQLTGYDPDDSLQRYTLETAALGARMLDWPRQPL